MVSPEEIEVLKSYTFIAKPLLEKMNSASRAAKQKRGSVKRVKVVYSLKELDKIIRCIADRANERDSPDSIQYTLDNLFGRFAEKYNRMASANRLASGCSSHVP